MSKTLSITPQDMQGDYDFQVDLAKSVPTCKCPACVENRKDIEKTFEEVMRGRG